MRLGLRCIQALGCAGESVRDADDSNFEDCVERAGWLPPRPLLFLDLQISLPAGLIFATHRDDIPAIPCSTEGANRWRLLAEQGRRLRVRPRQPSLRGSRETPPGSTTWVRPATGWWSG